MYLDTHVQYIHMLLHHCVLYTIHPTWSVYLYVIYSPNKQFLVCLVHGDLFWHVPGQQSVTVVNWKVRMVLKPDRTLRLERGVLGIHPSYGNQRKKRSVIK